jgi:PAS domain S-box-containing protein
VPQPQRDIAALFTAIVESSDDAIISQTSSGTITSWNRAAERIFGYTEAEAIGQSIRLIVPADRYGEEDEALRRIQAGQGVDHYEAVRRRKDGQSVDVSIAASLIRAADGTIIGVSTIARDDGPRRMFERETFRLAAIVESSDDAIVSKDLNGVIRTWNRAAERMFGFTAAEAVGRSIVMIIPADRLDEETEVLRRVRAGHVVDHFETVRQRKDGTRTPISLTVSPIRDAAGRVIGASKIARDISDRHRAAAHAESVNHRAVFLAQVSAALTRSFDYGRALKTVASLAVPQIADWCAVDLLGDEGSITRVAVAHVDPGKTELGEYVQVPYEEPSAASSPTYVIRSGVRAMVLPAYLCVPMITHAQTLGALTFAMAQSGREYTEDDLRFAEDIAARAALAIETARAYEQLRTANRLKDEFLATLSHELRTPLNAVLGYTRMLRSGAMASNRIPIALDVIERNATALTRIVEDVLDVSRIVSGKARLQVQPVDLAALTQNAVATVIPAGDARGVRIQILADSNLNPVSGDPDRLQQVLWNLLSNAVKFTPRGGRVQVRLERINSCVEIVVSDTGIGIPSAFLPHLFERFRQAEGGPTRRHGGLGLGLAISRHIVEMHGGTINAASEGEGKGATLRVRLPLMIVHAETFPTGERVHPRAERPGTTGPLPHLGGVHVLAVDDDEDSLRLLREILETAGARVTTVGSAAAALQTLESARPDILVADLGMPAMDGFDLIERVRHSIDPALRDIPAAALTAYARSEDRARSLRSGFEMHLAKPIDPTELAAAVFALARRRHARR